MSNCMQLKHKIQDLVDQKAIQIDEPQSNTDHGVFKSPLPNYDKGGEHTNQKFSSIFVKT
jgi:uncharacterized protein with NAD-binding domain and iron-sulfur cluster